MNTAPRVLIVDDNVELAENLAEIFGEEGIACAVARSGREAVELLADHPAQVVLTDLKMDGMSGLDVLRAVHQDHPHVPVIVMTGYAKDRTVETAKREGAMDIIYKPVDIEALIANVRRLIDGSGSVLIVEDDDDLRDNEVEMLALCPSLRVRSVRTAEAALTACRAERPDLVILDVRLPDRSGIDLSWEIREYFAPRPPVIVFVTAYPQELHPRLHEDALSPDPGTPWVLEKPFSAAQLMALVRRVV